MALIDIHSLIVGKAYKENASGFNAEMARLQARRKILRAGVPDQQIKP